MKGSVRKILSHMALRYTFRRTVPGDVRTGVEAMAGEKTEREMTNELSILAAAWRLERYGFTFDTKMSGCVGDRNGSSILKGLAEDEEQHRRWIERRSICSVTLDRSWDLSGP